MLAVGGNGETVGFRCSSSGCSRLGVVIGPWVNRSIEGNLVLTADVPGPEPSPLPPGKIGAVEQSGPVSILPYALGILVLGGLGFLYWRQVRRR